MFSACLQCLAHHLLTIPHTSRLHTHLQVKQFIHKYLRLVVCTHPQLLEWFMHSLSLIRLCTLIRMCIHHLHTDMEGMEGMVEGMVDTTQVDMAGTVEDITSTKGQIESINGSTSNP